MAMQRTLRSSLLLTVPLILGPGITAQGTNVSKITGDSSTSNATPSATGPAATIDSAQPASAATNQPEATTITANPEQSTDEQQSSATTGPTAEPGTALQSVIATFTTASSKWQQTDQTLTRIQSSIVSITNQANALSTGGLIGLPKIGVTYPPVSVPNLAGAPFMQHSDLPEGTFFIALGGVLALFAFGTLLWQAMQACLLKRSVRRIALQPPISEKVAYSRAMGYNRSDLDLLPGRQRDWGGSTLSLTKLRNNRDMIPLEALPQRWDKTPQTPLFFSPTAEVTSPNTGISQSRMSSYLSAGYYPSSAALPGGQPHQSQYPSRPSSRNQSFVRKVTAGNVLGSPTGNRASASYVSLNNIGTPPESPLFAPYRPGSSAGHSSRPTSTTGMLASRSGHRPVSLYGPPSIASNSTLDLNGWSSRTASTQLDGAAGMMSPGSAGGSTPSMMLNQMLDESTQPGRQV